MNLLALPSWVVGVVRSSVSFSISLTFHSKKITACRNVSKKAVANSNTNLRHYHRENKEPFSTIT
jgi:hypothetical protein